MRGDRQEAFLFFPKDFVSDNKVSAMSPAEVGAYIRLLCRAWYEDPPGSIPDDDILLAKWTGMGKRNWLRAKPKVLSVWAFSDSTRRYHQKRLCSEYMYSEERAAKNSKKARNAAKKRWDSYKESCLEHSLEHACSNGLALLEHSNSDAPICQSQSQSQSSSLFLHSSEKEEEEKSFCAEMKKASSPAPPSPTLLTFPCNGTAKSWDLTEKQLAEWKELFPSLDLLAECRSALAWVDASPSRKKTAGGMKRFLVGWFGRAQDKGRANGNGNGKPQLCKRDQGRIIGSFEEEDHADLPY